MLTIIQVGDNPASNVYIRNKVKAVEEAGLKAEVIKLPETVTTADVLDVIIAKANDSDCRALMVQLPLPEHISKDTVLGYIPWDMDIDGLNPKSHYKPLTPCAIMRWLREKGVGLEGKNVTILGRSELVGKPLANMMIDARATVTVCNSRTDKPRMTKLVQSSDIVVSAVGKSGVVAGYMVNPSIFQVFIDVGINRDEDGHLCGDVSPNARESLEKMGHVCTPVPGGVGKWTVRELVLRLKEMEGVADA